VRAEAVHRPVAGGWWLTAILHRRYVNASITITETPETTSLLQIRHWKIRPQDEWRASIEI